MSKLITVASFTSPMEAYIAKGRLEAEDIQVFVAHEYYIWLKWPYSDALGGVKLQVFANDANAASELIQSHLNGEYESALDEEFDEIELNSCKKCGSYEYASRFSKPLLLLVLYTLFFFIIFPVRREFHTCLKCGHKWKY